MKPFVQCFAAVMLATTAIDRVCCIKTQEFTRERKTKLSSWHTERSTSLMRCCSECVKFESCVAVNFNEMTSQCRLLLTSPDALYEDANWNLYSKKRSCPSGWVPGSSSSSCYRFVTTVLEWSDAKLNCEVHNSRLIHIESAEEMKFITERYLVSQGAGVDSFYIGGGNYLYANTTWSWSNGDIIVYENWYNGEPQFHLFAPQAIKIVPAYNFSWFSTDSTDEMASICEMNMTW